MKLKRKKLKKLHKRMWNYILYRVVSADYSVGKIPSINRMEEEFFKANGLEDINSNCIACHYDYLSGGKGCEKCPLDIKKCIEDDSEWNTLLQLLDKANEIKEDVTSLEEAKRIIIKIRDAWKKEEKA